MTSSPRRIVATPHASAGPGWSCCSPPTGRPPSALPQPAPTKAGTLQSRDEIGGALHELPEETGAIVFDHQHHRALVDAVIVARKPARFLAGFSPPAGIETAAQAILA